MSKMLQYQPPLIPDEVVKLSYPAEHVLHIAMDRPKSYNAMNNALNETLDCVLDWFEREPSLYVVILGSTNRKAWCAGADLKELRTTGKLRYGRNGFGGMSTRFTRKPIIGAINGFAMGGGSEMVVNLDIAIAGKSATFGFPEVKRGVSISAGGLPRFVRIVGHQKAMEYVLTGRNIPSSEALSLGMVNKVVPDDNVEANALEIALQIAANSPDSIMAIMHGVRITGQTGSVDEAFALNETSLEMRALWKGENLQEGLLAFQEKRPPKWRPSKL